MSRGKNADSARGARRVALVAVAADLFARKPYDEIFISDIAKEAGVAHGLLFYHFKDKRGLYLEVLKQSMAEMVDLHRPPPGEITREQRLRGVLRRQIEYRRDHLHTMLAMMRAGGQDPEVDAVFEEARRAGTSFLLDLLGVTDAPSPQLRVAMRGCMGCVDEMTVDWLTHDQDLDIDELERLGCAAVVAVLSRVRSAHPEVCGAVAELDAVAT
jgi:AcrR family transcriptional regulator